MTTTNSLNITLLDAKKIRPKASMLTVLVDKEDKYSHHIEGTDITLFIDKDFGWNEREKNAVNAIVVHPGDSGLKKDDHIVCWHNSFQDSQLIETFTFEEAGKIKKRYLYIIRKEWIYFKLEEDGQVVPMEGITIVDRIYKIPKTVSKLILLESQDQKEQNRVLVKVTAEGSPWKKGQVLLTETMSDYEVVYAHKGREQRLIRIKDENVMGIDHSFKIKDKLIRTGI